MSEAVLTPGCLAKACRPAAPTVIDDVDLTLEEYVVVAIDSGRPAPTQAIELCKSVRS